MERKVPEESRMDGWMSGEVGHLEWSQNREDKSWDPVVCSSVGSTEKWMFLEERMGVGMEPHTFYRGLPLPHVLLHAHTWSGQESENDLYHQ